MTERVIAVTIDIKTLRSKAPLGELPEEQLQRIARTATITEHQQGDALFRVGDTDPRHAYLLWGKVRLLSQDSKSSTIRHNQDSARFALAKLRPRRFKAEAALNGTCILWVDSGLLDECLGAVGAEPPHDEDHILITA